MRFFLILSLLLAASTLAAKAEPQLSPLATEQKGYATPVEPNLVTQASDLLDQGKLNEAKQILDEALTKNSKDAAALNELARYYLEEGILGVTNTNDGGSVFLVPVYKPGALEKAQETLLKSVEADPNYAHNYTLLAHVLLQNPNPKIGESMAHDTLQTAEKLAPNDPWVDYYWAELFAHKGDWNEVENHCLKLLQIDKTDKHTTIPAEYYLIQSYTAKHNYEKADALYTKLLQQKPSSYGISTDYSTFLRIYLGNFDKAIDYADKSLQIRPTREGQKAMALALYAKWGKIYISRSAPSEAQKYFDIANKTLPDLNYVMTLEGCYATEKALVLALKDRGVSIDAPAQSDGSTALMIAANNGRTDAVKMLLSLGANPNAVSKTGWTALMGAADGAYADVINVLLDGGADKDQNVNGKNAAMLAGIRGRTDIMEQIRNYKPHSKDDPNNSST